jgi:CcmD family protein
MAEGSVFWVMAVNLVIWTGIFLYLLRLDGKVRNLEKNP